MYSLAANPKGKISLYTKKFYSMKTGYLTKLTRLLTIFSADKMHPSKLEVVNPSPPSIKMGFSEMTRDPGDSL